MNLNASGMQLERDNMSAIVVTLAARKGGVGKTLLTQNLAGACLQLPQKPRILLFDADPQASLSTNTFGAEKVENLRPYETLSALFDPSRDPNPSEMVHPTEIDENLFIVPASDHLSAFNLPVPKETGQLQFVIRDFANEVGEDYDIILIDTGATTDALLAWGALQASDFVISPVQPEKNSCESVIVIKRRLADVMANGNPGLIDLGYFINNFDSRLALHHARDEKLRQLYGSQVFQTRIYARKSFKEAAEEHMPITHSNPNSDEAGMIRNLLEEFFMRIRQSLKDLNHNKPTEDCIE